MELGTRYIRSYGLALKFLASAKASNLNYRSTMELNQRRMIGSGWLCGKKRKEKKPGNKGGINLVRLDSAMWKVTLAINLTSSKDEGWETVSTSIKPIYQALPGTQDPT